MAMKSRGQTEEVKRETETKWKTEIDRYVEDLSLPKETYRIK